MINNHSFYKFKKFDFNLNLMANKLSIFWLSTNKKLKYVYENTKKMLEFDAPKNVLLLIFHIINFGKIL